jgi:NAD(P)-dependent dehydrogenase (short-subunit alcohol dehydrogenase family)
MGRVDAFFANAGVSGRGGGGKGFHEMATEEWRRVMAVNLDGAFFSLRAAARHMVERGGGGSLVSTASLAGVMGAARSEHYSATKGALMAMTRSMAVELARHQIRVNTVVPGWIDTPMTEKALHGEAFMQKVLPRVPMRRWGVGDDFGGIAVYLASDASRYHTGDAFIIDGGYLVF